MTIRILVVDDSEQMRRLFTTALDLEDDLEVVGTAPGATEAVDAVRSLDPDCVIVDWQMPWVTGPEAVPLLKGAKPDVRVILFSNVYGPSAERIATQSGADGFVEKQANLSELVATVRRLFTTA